VAASVGGDQGTPRPEGPGPATDLPFTEGAVAWSGRTDFSTWEPPAPEPRDPAAPCSADDLEVGRIEQDGAMQSTLLFVNVTKTTPGFCTLAGYPGLAGTDDTGTQVQVHVENGELMPPYGETPATIQQHETARLILSYGLNCAAGQGEAPLPYESWTDVALVLADGSTLALDRKITTVCAPWVGRFHWDDTPIEQPVRWGWLTASLTAPETVRAGETLVYVVTLANSGDEPLRLDPCGGYRQTLADNSAGEPAPLKGAHLTLRLNCDDDPVIPAGGEQGLRDGALRAPGRTRARRPAALAARRHVARPVRPDVRADHPLIRQAWKICPLRTSMSTLSRPLGAGPRVTSPVAASYWLPWCRQVIVPSSILPTSKPWCLQREPNAANSPAVGWVMTMWTSVRTIPPPMGISAVVASAPASRLGLPPDDSLPDSLPEPLSVLASAGVEPAEVDPVGVWSAPSEEDSSPPQPARTTATPSAPRPWKTMRRDGRGVVMPGPP
jgi:hypothetical protein